MLLCDKTKKYLYIYIYLLAVMQNQLTGIEVVFPLLVIISYALSLCLCYSICVTINLKIVGSPPPLIQIKNIIRKTWIEVVFPLLVFLCTLSFYYSIRVTIWTCWARSSLPPFPATRIYGKLGWPLKYDIL